MPKRTAWTNVRRLLAEPTVIFVLLAAALFAANATVRSYRREVIEIDRGAVERRIREIERGRGSSLTADERRLAESAYIDEMVLAREARLRGLDDDEKIRAILYQKMLHLLSGDVPQPTEAELRTYFEENRSRYGRPPAVTVEDVVLAGSTRQPGEVLEAGFEPQSLQGSAHSRPALLTRVTAGELTWSFGAETAAKVFDAEIGRWVGPHESGEGQHWFRVVDRFDSIAPPPLRSIREQVRFDWMVEREDALMRDRTAALRRKYSMKFTGTEPLP